MKRMRQERDRNEYPAGLVRAALAATLALTFVAPLWFPSFSAAEIPSSTSSSSSETEASSAPRATAIFAGGCFWCLEKPFDELDGVFSTTSGYTGGQLAHPTYEQVSRGDSGHVEAVKVEYDPRRVSYQKLLDTFWRNIDPVDAGGQFCDRGFQYTSAVFYGDAEQEKKAGASKRALAESGRLKAPIATRLIPASTFYDAEDYHQDYYKKNPIRYRYYRYRCGRDKRLAEVWGGKSSGD